MPHDLPPGDWISVVRAAQLLKVRYLKARDLVSQGELGEVHITSSNRHYVRLQEVEKYLATNVAE